MTSSSSERRDLALDAGRTPRRKLRHSPNEQIGLCVGVTTTVVLILVGVVVGTEPPAAGSCERWSEAPAPLRS